MLNGGIMYRIASTVISSLGWVATLNRRTSVFQVWPFLIKFRINCVKNLGSYFTDNTLILHYIDELMRRRVV